MVNVFWVQIRALIWKNWIVLYNRPFVVFFFFTVVHSVLTTFSLYLGEHFTMLSLAPCLWCIPG